MTPLRDFTRRMSPAQIRHAGAVAFRNRMRAVYPVTLPSRPPVVQEEADLRAPEGGETPLSADEIEFGVTRGLIRTARVRAFAEEAH